MNWVDLVVLGVILVSGVLGLARGLLRESLGLGAWIASGVAAYELSPTLQPWVRQQTTDPALADTLAFLGVFIVVLIALSIVAGVLGGAIRGTMLGGLDRTLGIVFGLVRGAVLVCAAYIVVGLAISVDQWPPVVTEARALPFVYRGATLIAEHAPAGFRPAVAAPPKPGDGRPATATELMQANPVGRALGARRPRE